MCAPSNPFFPASVFVALSLSYSLVVLCLLCFSSRSFFFPPHFLGVYPISYIPYMHVTLARQQPRYDYAKKKNAKNLTHVRSSINYIIIYFAKDFSVSGEILMAKLICINLSDDDVTWTFAFQVEYSIKLFLYKLAYQDNVAWREKYISKKTLFFSQRMTYSIPFEML